LLRHQRSKEAFTLNCMFTKKLALEAAGNMLRSGLTKDESMAEVEQRTSSILSTDRKGVYSEKVRLKQLLEVRLLIDHYQKLITSEGKTYPDMARSAYGDRASFESFLNRLSAAEKEVNRAALQLAGKNPEAKDFVARMEESVKQVRRRDLDNYFPLSE
ncbi:MAG: NF038143 family protein, partial [Dehalococcoidia bacterium]